MKKLKLKALELGANEVLSRAQLRNILGGSGSGSGSGEVCIATAVCDPPSNQTVSCEGWHLCFARDGEGVNCDQTGFIACEG